MKKILLSLFATAVFFATDAVKAQTVIFEDSFETYTDFAIANVGNWTLIDVDLKPTFAFNGVTYPNAAVPKAFQVFNSTLTTPPLTPSATSNWTARTGVRAMVSIGADSAPWSNDWLISPQIPLGAVGGVLTFWAKGTDATYGAEKFKVLVSTTGTAIGDFTAISPVITTPSDAAWHKYTYSLIPYAGQNIHVAIQCTSEDQFGFAVDDFLVATPPTAAPACPALVSPANGATGINYYVPVPLSWTASAGADSYDVYLGTSPNATTLLKNVEATSTTVTALAGTTYYWKVLAKNTFGDAIGCSEFSFTTNLAPTSPPICPVLVAPANASTNVDYLAPVALSWTASTGATSYDVYLGTTPNPVTLLRNVVGTSTTAAGLLPSTTYYWKVLGKNEAGDSVGCTDFTFTTAANPFAPYCGPLLFGASVEPITLVNFAGINNVSSPATAGAVGHENFTTIIGNVNQGGSYTMTLKGNTDGPYTNRFAVFIDWNQNGVLDDNGETYLITQTIVGSTGVDAIEAVQTLAVPAGATLGNTRMRVKKIFGTTAYANPCLGTSFGQAEDYTINVAAALAVNDNVKNAIRVYPNPVIDMLNIEAPSNVKSVSVFDLSGKAVSTQVLNSAKSQINLSRLAPGVYIVNIEVGNEVKAVKILKK